MIHGYIRVSIKDKNRDRYKITLIDAGVPAKDIILDKQSGEDFNRPGYLRLCKKVKPGDTLFVKNIDRLGRNYNEILEQWRYLTKDKHIAIVVLDTQLLDTRKGKDLTGERISDSVLQLLSYVAQTEWEFVRRATFVFLKEQWEKKQISARKVAKQLGVIRSTFLRWENEDIG